RARSTQMLASIKIAVMTPWSRARRITSLRAGICVGPLESKNLYTGVGMLLDHLTPTLTGGGYQSIPHRAAGRSSDGLESDGAFFPLSLSHSFGSEMIFENRSRPGM